MPLLRDSLQKESLGWYSSFACVEKTLETVVQRCLMQERLKKLLYYPDKNALKMPKLTQAQGLSLVGESILVVPKLVVTADAKPCLIINLDSFVPENGSTTFRQVSLSIDIFCPFDLWNLGDYQLRPYLLAGEVDGAINKATVGEGIARFVGAKQLTLNEHLGGISLYYQLETFGDDRAPSGN